MALACSGRPPPWSERGDMAGFRSGAGPRWAGAVAARLISGLAQALQISWGKDSHPRCFPAGIATIRPLCPGVRGRVWRRTSSARAQHWWWVGSLAEQQLASGPFVSQGLHHGSGHCPWVRRRGRARQRSEQGLAECGLAGRSGMALAADCARAGQTSSRASRRTADSKDKASAPAGCTAQVSHLERSRVAAIFAERSDQKQRAVRKRQSDYSSGLLQPWALLSLWAWNDSMGTRVAMGSSLSVQGG